ncbi:S-layer homology domain-containing protein [Tissierella sp.]|uniref:S-layer homology domain-containing protein n=1 Tax=Tissierella sp. TaxID=41274 RepID=UPI0028636AC3|nr:S-layer homology domain-containing protein [Tissierella sp.]MDR7855697.1 S-layer homology domain-containing protein [Tissierella sp.]
MRAILKVMVILIILSILVPTVVIADTNQDKLKEMLETYNETIKEHEATKEKVKEENKEEIEGKVEELVTSINFPDVHSYHWFKDDVRDLVSRGSISGFPDGTFRPFDKVTRAEFLKMAILSVDKTIQGVPTIDHWASGILNSAYDLGIVLKSEISQTNMDLNTNITRSEMARILVRVNEIIQKEPPVSTSGIENIMYDYYHVEHKFKSYVEQAYMKGLVAGSGNRSIFNGRNTGSRAEASAMIIRLLDNSKRVKVDFDKKWYPDYNGALVNEKGQMAEMKAKEFVLNLLIL